MDTNFLYFNTDFSMHTMPTITFPQVDFQQWHFNFPFPTFPFLNQSLISPSTNFNFNFSSSLNNQCGDSFTSTFTSHSGDSSTSTSSSHYSDSFAKKSKNKFNFSDYDAKAGKKLAQTALRDSVGFKGRCATYVKNAIQKAGLGDYQYGDAYKMTAILKNNPNFKEVSAKGLDVQNLPAGCVLVYNKGEEGYSQKYGHTEITTGDGRAVSDGITKNLHKQPSTVFVPVSA